VQLLDDSDADPFEPAHDHVSAQLRDLAAVELLVGDHAPPGPGCADARDSLLRRRHTAPAVPAVLTTGKVPCVTLDIHTRGCSSMAEPQPSKPGLSLACLDLSPGTMPLSISLGEALVSFACQYGRGACQDMALALRVVLIG
jgi:hypothetical protein